MRVWESWVKRRGMRGGKGEKGERKRMRWACWRMLGRDGKGREGLAGGGGIGLWAETRDSQPPKRLKPIWHSCSLLHKTDTYNYPLLFTVLEPKTENKDRKELGRTLTLSRFKGEGCLDLCSGLRTCSRGGPRAGLLN
ncbi:hypothetical protein E2C01_067655 [Portunus trituberculatus]|uniref:Uncharacterized protein n=1 Tax=Portunus trituberculatus TaxID=210409 RepID=A0A5B7HPX1_PORTR|nr:hypothetical protein [Portunus trituberculatus]